MWFVVQLARVRCAATFMCSTDRAYDQKPYDSRRNVFRQRMGWQLKEPGEGTISQCEEEDPVINTFRILLLQRGNWCMMIRFQPNL
jgi:hypothetical protein